MRPVQRQYPAHSCHPAPRYLAGYSHRHRPGQIPACFSRRKRVQAAHHPCARKAALAWHSDHAKTTMIDHKITVSPAISGTELGFSSHQIIGLSSHPGEKRIRPTPAGPRTRRHENAQPRYIPKRVCPAEARLKMARPVDPDFIQDLATTIAANISRRQ